MALSLTACQTTKTNDIAILTPSMAADKYQITTWQEQQLKNEFDTKEVQIDRNQNTILLTIQEDNAFKSEYTLKDSFKKKLDTISRLVQPADSQIRIINHTDSDNGSNIDPSAWFRSDYSEDDSSLDPAINFTAKRSLIISRYFIDNGVFSNKISFFGVGSNQPIADNSTSDGKKINRRVEIQIINQ